jgi:hypothetical protein
VGVVVPLQRRQSSIRKGRPVQAPQELPLLLARLLAAGATEFTRVALDAWANQELNEEELVELCSTYAAVAGLETV